MSVEGTIGMPDGAAFKTEELIKRKKAQIMIGPLSGNEGLTIRNLADEYPHITFVNGLSGAQELTLNDTPPNFFNFALNGTQVVAGIGIMHIRNWAIAGWSPWVRTILSRTRRWATLCSNSAARGKVIDKKWVRVGESDFSDVIAQLPDDVDAIFLALGVFTAENPT